MSKPEKKPLVPALRFPEFREAGEWNQKTLDDVAVFFKGKGISKSDIDSQGEMLCIRYGELYTIYGEVITTVFSKTKLPASELFLSQKYDVLIPSSGETKIDIAKASCILFNDIALGGDLNVLRPNENGVFLSYMLNGVCKREIAKKAQGDTVVHLYSSQLKLLDILVPKEQEQQKIADCLSSIDDLITAQTQKLAALKAHKKGLMQQLFPAEGETVPKLRFPEFRDGGEWERKNILEVAETSIGLVTTMTKSYSGKGVPLIRNSDIQPNKVAKEKLVYLLEDFANKHRSKKLHKGDIVTVHTGDIGVSAVIDKELHGCLGFATLNTRIISTKLLPSFLCWYFNTSTYISFALSMATGDGRNNFNLKDFDKSVVLVPSIDEQQKIVDCLSSVDELITAQSQKIEALKSHKKGLMQQLFPSMDEVDG